MSMTKLKYNSCCRDCQRELKGVPLVDRLGALRQELIDERQFDHAASVRDAICVLKKAGHLVDVK